MQRFRVEVPFYCSLVQSTLSRTGLLLPMLHVPYPVSNQKMGLAHMLEVARGAHIPRAPFRVKSETPS